MGSSMKDALLKAGYKTAKMENERPKVNAKQKTQTQVHQEERNFCEVCNSVQPDVERYKHRNALIDAQWICTKCADENMIHDKFRVTAQSDYSKKKIFSRRFGPTLDPSKNQA